MTRPLRPTQVIASGALVWLLDASQPVAVAIDPADGAVAAIVDWPVTVDEAGPWWQERAVAADGSGGIIVQTQFGGPLTWLTVDGERAWQPADGVALFSARDGVAWCGYGAYIEPGSGASSVGTIAVISADGSRREIDVDRPVRNLRATEDGVVVVVAKPVVVTPRPSGGATYEYPESAVLLGHDYSGHSLRVADLPAIDRPPVPDSFAWWDELDEGWIAAHGIAVGELRFVWGSPGDENQVNRPAVVLGYAADGVERVRCELGVGVVRGAAVVGDELMVIFSAGRELRVDKRRVVLLAIDRAGHSRRVALADDIDIAAHCVAAERPSEVVIAEAEQALRDEFGEVIRRWSKDPATKAWVDIVDDWPRTECHVHVRGPEFGELTLRRRIRLFDEFGRPIQHLFPSIELEEDIESGYLPPSTEAVDGVLDF